MSVAGALGPNWGMWVPLFLGGLTLFLPWWRYAEAGIPFSVTQSPLDGRVPGQAYAWIAFIGCIVTSGYLVLRDERLGAHGLGWGDSWIGLLGCLVLLPTVFVGVRGLVDSDGFVLPATFLNLLTLLLVLVTALNAVATIRLSDRSASLLHRGTWRVPSRNASASAGSPVPRMVP